MKDEVEPLDMSEPEGDIDPCPKCETPLQYPVGGGVSCPNCGYWFCY